MYVLFQKAFSHAPSHLKNKNIDGRHTLYGYIMELMEKIPSQGDSCSDAFLRYTVQTVKENRILKVKVRVLQQEDFEV